MSKQVSGLFDSTAQDQRVYTDADLARVFRMLSGDGVSALGDNLRVEAALDGLKSRVRYGTAMCRGYYYELADDGGGAFTLAHEAAPSLPRVDRVVLRLNLDTQVRAIELAIKKGTAASTPVPPALARTATLWELSLAQVRVSTGAVQLRAEDIADEREDAAVCGRCDPVGKLMGAAGTGSGLDADKLDGLHAAAFATAAQGAKADAALPASGYTAADALAKLKTVDGTGSGLDADMLDGQHASAFALASNTARRALTASVSIPTSGWTYQSAYDRYALTLAVTGAQAAWSPVLTIDPAVAGPKVPVYAVQAGNGSVTLYAQEPPTVAASAALWFEAVG